LGAFGKIWAKILRTPKHLPAPTPMAPTGGNLGPMEIRGCVASSEQQEWQNCSVLALMQHMVTGTADSVPSRETRFCESRSQLSL